MHIILSLGAAAVFTVCGCGRPFGVPFTSSSTDVSGKNINYSPIGPVGDFQILFHDEFTDPTLSQRTWSYGYWFNGIIDNQLQAYRPENAILENGLLKLRAEKRSTQTLWGIPMEYASAAINTFGKLSFTYGVIEARVKMPSGQGLQAMFTLRQEDPVHPKSVQIAMVLGQEPDRTLFDFSTFTTTGGATVTKPGSYKGINMSSDFHTLTLEWTVDSIHYYIDGIERRTINANTSWELMDKPANIMLNLIVGGGTAGAPNASTVFPADFAIDYVRVWQAAPAAHL